MKEYKTTNQMTDSEMTKEYFGIITKANELGAEMIANFGFNTVNPYIIAIVPDEVDPNTLFPDFDWEFIEPDEGDVVYSDGTELGDPEVN